MFKRLSLRGLLILLVAIAWAVPSAAQIPPTSVSVSGNAQFFIGQGLPIPHPSFGGARPITSMGNGSATTPGGGGPAGGAVTAMVTIQGPSSKASIVFPPNQFKHDGKGFNQPVLFANPNVFQVYTNLALTFPKTTVTFKAGGRTGPPTATFCPGYTGVYGCLDPTNNPVNIPVCTPGSCPQAASCVITKNNATTNPPTTAGCAIQQVPGMLRYVKTINQFGGASRGNVGGTFDVALKPTTPPGIVAFVGGSPNPTGAIGAAFGVFNQNNPAPLFIYPITGYVTNVIPSGEITGIIPFKISTMGGVTATMGGNPVPAPGNTSTGSFGGPFTTGTLTISQPQASPPEKFVLYGHDVRQKSGALAGQGQIVLVGGAVSQRKTTKANGNRGIIKLTVPEPGAIAGLAGALGVLLGCHRLVRRRSKYLS